MSELYDLVVVGGGVNGAGIARDAAGRGLKVLLCERADLASGTSSASTKLIHGGLRYLEHYEFRLVRESLKEREVLLRCAPHLIEPMDFVLPHHKGLRPAAILRMGLFIYDHIGGRRLLPSTRTLDLRSHIAGEALKDDYKKGFQYADCWVDDARLVVSIAIDAAARGAEIRTRTEFKTAARQGGRWRIMMVDEHGGELRVEARALVNAAGPWVFQTRKAILGNAIKGRVRLVKGSHMIVPKMFEAPQSYILQNDDRRIFFAIPYERDFTLVGTTDVPYDGDARSVAISAEEIEYLCEGVNTYFERQLSPQDVISSYSGVRPLYDDGSADASRVTRDYTLTVYDEDGSAPLMSVYGGKITTFRKLAEQALGKLQPYLAFSAPDWTRGALLPGGDIPGLDVRSYAESVHQTHPFLEFDLALRWSRAYGTRVHDLLAQVQSAADLGHHFGSGLYQVEVDFLMRHEWARTAQDVLWRRSKLGLVGGDELNQKLEGWFAERARSAA